MLANIKLQLIINKNDMYPIGYFNSLSLLMRLTSNKAHRNRRLIMQANSSILQALWNATNKDWRIIKLRADLANNHWTVLFAEPRFYKEFTHHLLENINEEEQERLASTSMTQPREHEPAHHSKRPRLERHETHEDDQDARDELDRQDYTNQDHDPRGPRKIVKISKPQLEDYLRRNLEINKHKTQVKREMNSCMTMLCRSLDNKVETWANIPASWLNGIKMVTLGDLLADATDTSQLIHQPNGELLECKECAQGNTGPTAKHMLLHRVLDCTNQRYRQAQKELEETLRKTERPERVDQGPYSKSQALRKVVGDKLLCQQVLEILAKCAL